MGNDLAQRAQGAANNRAEGNGKPTLAQLIELQKPEIARALPKHLDPDRIARIALTVLRQTPKLAECTPESFLGALMTASQLGLEPGPLGEAYLVPYGRTVTFIPGYRGLIKLAWQSGQLKNIDAHVVHEGDDFDFEYGLTPFLRHKPGRGKPGKATEVYACASLLNGGSTFIVMAIEEVDAIRKRSKASGSGPWVTDWEAMAKKTAIKQLIRFLPLSTEMHNLATAAHLDGTSRTKAGADLDDAPVTWVESESTPPEIEASAEVVDVSHLAEADEEAEAEFLDRP